MVFGIKGKDYYIPYYTKFMDENVRIVVINNQRYMIVKDMFRALGRLKNTTGKISSDDMISLRKLYEDLELEKEKDYKERVKVLTKNSGTEKEYPSSQGNKKNGELQEQNLINVKQIPIILLQFKPTKKATNYEVKLDIWRKFLRFVNSILQDYQLENYIIQDKEEWKENTRELEEMGLDPTIVNKHININMAKAIGVYNQGIKEITKEELKIYESQTTMDLLAVRQELYVKYKEIYNLFNSKEMAIKGSLNFIIDKYKLKIEKEIIKK